MKIKYLVMACLIGAYAGQAQASALLIAATVDGLEERKAKEELAEQLKEVADIKQERARLEAIVADQAALIEAGLESSDPKVKAQAEIASKKFLAQVEKQSERDYLAWQAEQQQREAAIAKYETDIANRESLNKELSGQLRELSWFMGIMIGLLAIGLLVGLKIVRKEKE